MSAPSSTCKRVLHILGICCLGSCEYQLQGDTRWDAEVKQTSPSTAVDAGGMDASLTVKVEEGGFVDVDVVSDANRWLDAAPSDASTDACVDATACELQMKVEACVGAISDGGLTAALKGSSKACQLCLCTACPDDTLQCSSPNGCGGALFSCLIRCTSACPIPG